jgi:hypothetical protein
MGKELRGFQTENEVVAGQVPVKKNRRRVSADRLREVPQTRHEKLDLIRASAQWLRVFGM